MSRRAAGLGRLLLAGLLLGSLGLAAPAAGQPQDPLKVSLRDSAADNGRLKVTVAMSGPAWTGERLDPGPSPPASTGSRSRASRPPRSRSRGAPAARSR